MNVKGKKVMPDLKSPHRVRDPPTHKKMENSNFVIDLDRTNPKSLKTEGCPTPTP